MEFNFTKKFLTVSLATILVAGIGSPAFAEPANIGVPIVPLTPEQEARINDGPYAEAGDAGQLPGTAQQVQGVSGAVTVITGTLSSNNDVDMFRLCISDENTWEAITPATNIDPILSLFDKVGNGFVWNDDNTPPGSFGSRIGFAGPNVPAAPQEVLLAISSFSNDPTDGGADMRTGPNADLQTTLTGTVDGWNNDGFVSGAYQIILTGFDLDSCSQAVGGELLPIDNTALLLAGMQSMTVWMIPTVLGLAGAGVYLVKFRKN